MQGVGSGIIGGVIAVVLLGLLSQCFKKLSFKLNSQKHAGYDRELTSIEQKWLSVNARMLSREKSNKKYPIWAHFLWSGTLPVIIGMGSVFSFIYIAYQILALPVDSMSLAWSRVDFGVSFVMSVFL